MNMARSGISDHSFVNDIRPANNDVLVIMLPGMHFEFYACKSVFSKGTNFERMQSGCSRPCIDFGFDAINAEVR
jgi:hypothetical protein